jgi:hypothetical protein
MMRGEQREGRDRQQRRIALGEWGGGIGRRRRGQQKREEDQHGELSSSCKTVKNWKETWLN